MNLSWAQVRKTNETVSIERLHTAFPYGLDDKIGEEYHLKTTDIISLKMQSLPRSHQYIRGIKHQTTFWSRVFG